MSGKDDYGHFTVAPPPAGRLLEEDFERCRRDVELKRGVLYEGVTPGVDAATSSAPRGGRGAPLAGI